MRRILFSLAILFAATTAAGAADVYEVKDVSVSIPNVDANKSRNDAMFEAEKKAFDEVQKRLLSGGFISARKTLQIGDISAAVDTIDIVSEKSSAKDYRATYNIVFSKGDISRIFGIAEIAPTEDQEKYFVVPIVIEDGKLKIWKNDWSKNWTAKKHDNIILPLGDLQDLQNIREDELAAKKYDNLKKAETRYGANNIVIVKGEYLKDKNVLNVKLEKIKDRERITITYEYPGKTGITTADLFEAAANDIIYRLENKKLTDASVDPDDENDSAEISGHKPPRGPEPAPRIPEPYSPDAPGTGFIGEKKPPYQPPSALPAIPTTQPTAITPAVPAGVARTDMTVIANDLIAWNRIRTKLIATPGISDLQIKSFVNGKANISINKNQDMSVLATSLKSQGLELSGGEGSWQIKESH